MATGVENAYFAGLLDGEGSLEIERTRSKARKHYHYYPMVIITNTHKGVLEIAKRIYGGCVYQRPDQNGHKPIFNWILSSRKADSFIQLVLPYLVIKKEQAEVVSTFYEGIFINGHQPPDEEVKRRDRVVEQLKRIQRR